MRIRQAVALFTVLSSLAGCAWFEGEDEAPLEGRRIPVLQHQQTLSPDPQAGAEPVVLPPPMLNSDWPQAGGSVTHNMQHPTAAGPATAAWQTSVGSGATSFRPLIAPPVVGGGRVYAMDTRHRVGAFAAENGAALWRVDLAAKTDDDDAIVGGIGYDNGRLFATTGFGDVVALDAGNGREIWRTSIRMPMHGPPTIDGGRVFAISIDNTLHALSAADGRALWPAVRTLAEPAALLGTANPAAAAGAVIAAFSSGEVLAVRQDNGRVLWSEALGSQRRTDELALLSDIRARPVIDGARVLAVSYSGMLAAFDLRTGQRLWEREIGSIHAPWVAGRFQFVISADNQLACLSTGDGAVIWVVQLPSYENEKKRQDPILWAGPLLLSEQLYVFGSNGVALAISPRNGSEQRRMRLPAGVSAQPAVANGTLFVLDDDAVLTAYR